MGFGRAKRRGGVELLYSSYGVQAKKGGDQFYGGRASHKGEFIPMGGDDPSSYQDLLDYNKPNNLINFYILTQNIISAI